MATFETSPDELARRLTESLAVDLEKVFKAHILKNIDPMVSEIARDLARQTQGKIRAYRQSPARDNLFADSVVVSLSFNNKDVQYVDKT